MTPDVGKFKSTTPLVASAALPRDRHWKASDKLVHAKETKRECSFIVTSSLELINPVPQESSHPPKMLILLNDLTLLRGSSSDR